MGITRAQAHAEAVHSGFPALPSQARNGHDSAQRSEEQRGRTFANSEQVRRATAAPLSEAQDGAGFTQRSSAQRSRPSAQDTLCYEVVD